MPKASGKKVGRPTKTAAEKQKTGTLRTSKKSKVVNLGAADPVMNIEYPAPPDDLGIEGKKQWECIARELSKIRLLTPVDLFVMRAMCIEWECYILHRRQQMEDGVGSYYKIEGKNGTSYQPHPIHYNGTNHLREYTRLAQEFGLTPASRASIGITAQDNRKSRAAELLKNAV